MFPFTLSYGDQGNLEFVDRHTKIDAPHFVGPGGMLMSAIDILPTELGSFFVLSQFGTRLTCVAADASKYFSSRILPYVRNLISPNPSSQGVDHSLRRATIVQSGVLSTEHEWLQPRVDAVRATKSSSSSTRPTRKKVLLLGSGLVAGPAVEVFAASSDLQLTIGEGPAELGSCF